MTAAQMDIVIGADVTQAIAAMKKLGYQITQTGQAATKFTQKGKTDFTNLGRVIQDLPFGFTAIQNNLTQLIPAAGAMGLAFSALIAAVTFAQVGFSAWTRGMGQSKEALDEVSKSVAGAQTEIVKISSLLSIARGLGESTQARKNAIAELQKEYPGYLKNLTLENVNSQETSHAVDMLSQALTRKAKVQAVSNLLTKANEKLLQAQNTTIAENVLSINAFLGLLKSGAGAPGQGAIGLIAGATKETTGNIAEATEEVKQLAGTLAELTGEQARNSDFSLLSPTTPKKLKKVAEGFAHINANIKGIKGILLSAIGKETGDNINKLVGPQGALTITPTVQVKPNLDLNYLQARAADMAGIIETTISDAFVAVGEGIGNFITGQGSLFSGIFEVIGSGLQRLGKYVIATSVLIGKISKAIEAAFIGNPILGIGLGIAMVALGTVLKNIPKFATGGVVTSPTLALVGEQGPERITPLGYEGRANNVMQGEVVFQISGQSLRGILRRADNVAFNTF